MRGILSFLLKLIGLVSLILGLSVLAVFLLAGYWMQTSDEPQPSDAMVVLGGSYYRAYYAADLYAQGYAPRIYISRTRRYRTDLLMEELGYRIPRQEEVNARILTARGVPTSAITPYGEEVMSTAMEAQELARTLGPGPRRLLVVTSPSHVHRARLVLRDNLPQGYDLRVTATPYESLPKNWWSTQRSAIEVLTETAKTLYYLAGGKFRADEAEPGQDTPVTPPAH